ncbi:Uncharacterised protein [[Clostridium] sordellii]|uniref:Uncharacterized protein n=1 Tax=Paraclostridium sordellii TaxID=1505 RepID=A0ABP1XSL7_PARSO|nr:hypothetical protein [Paeniclostridium sordellii]CEJ74169.1 hypothetical protein ATCC9714_20571 [[Clostridium] sordellii] [Paeniclostridium sordellii]CEN69713.1 Uncharacterised protein [[Clostridium] sordellii] [Paeniclostridium sordellii]CEN72981.1 Uncharacterised protein [[Clostridium] sordellii] [Paeniclostridium sordellii]CEO25433.1 Uncharacterised protein [[Clostridium] sordellii] [Paeniclostridium sordellii]CEP75426.1 Uncharacterised protein [[Clostridium] sordellii] [Paeniclostridium
MKDEFNNNNSSNKYSWNDAMILDKIQEILEVENIDDLEFNEEMINQLKTQLSENLSSEEINQSAYMVAQNIEELKVLPKEDIKAYISRLKSYLNNTNFSCIKAEFKGIEFEIYQDSSIEDVFKSYYSRYDQIYGISQMLSDLGLK